MKRNLFYALLLVFFATSCNRPSENMKNRQTESADIIGKPSLELTSDRMTPEVLWAFGQLSGNAVSPDKQIVMFGVKYYDIEQNKGNRELYNMALTGDNSTQTTKTAKSEVG